ncbi:MAG TPA: excinuclease ABC subunit UvrB [Tepidisphaeraceae bacterium]|jgi:excinuclease ABC subunit B|nr:excinuclease ABC subunit UvrB [Tepidisphaeraceae bacterium]
MRNQFQVISPFKPEGDQPQAIDKLTSALNSGQPFQTLLGATGTGKTFTMAHTIARINRPTLVISHNKTLAAQLYEEFKDLFPNNAVGYFVSYYDYYQPEAYIPQRDIYIEKDASRNDDLDRLRLSATSNLVSRRDVLLVASVSCIFGLGSPESYRSSVLPIRKGVETDRDEMLRKLIDLQYARNDIDFKRSTFRVRGDVVEVHPSYEEFAYRIEFFGDEITSIHAINPLTGELLKDEDAIFIYPAVHYVMPEDKLHGAVENIKAELETQVMHLRGQGKLLEAQRLLARTKYDLEMLVEVGVCPGIENYSRHLDGRKPGEKPYTLIDYFPKDYLLIIDESHVTMPQIKAMYNGDRHRKETLVEHGFRLPSALDNRPLKIEEFEKMWNQVVFVSATPSKYEFEKTGGEIVEQIIRPTGLVDPIIEIKPAQGQVPHLLQEIKIRAAKGERVLVTTLTKRLAEDLSAYIQEAGIRGRYLHSEIQTLERVEILKDLRQGDFDVLVGVNLLREGLDLPEVSMVAILDADKAGFLRSETSIIQMVGRAARNVNAMVYLYADTITPAMQKAMEETNRRRTTQLKFNADHGITPTTIVKAIRNSLESEVKARKTVQQAIHATGDEVDRTELIKLLEEEMLESARNLEFERAAQLRDKLAEIKGSPMIQSSGGPLRDDPNQKIWQPKSKGRPKRNLAK